MKSEFLEWKQAALEAAKTSFGDEELASFGIKGGEVSPHSRPKVDEFVPRTQHVNFRIVCQATRVRGYGRPPQRRRGLLLLRYHSQSQSLVTQTSIGLK